MFFFDGASCPVCNKNFSERDDIVTCPVCGTPHHRECYLEAGECVNTALHDGGFEWKKPLSDTSGSDSDKTSSPSICRVCGYENPEGMLYCRNCSSPIYLDENGRAPIYNDQTAAGGTTPPPGYDGGFYSFGASAFTVSDNEIIQDVSVGDYKKYIGRAWYYYIPTFFNLSRQGRKLSLNFTAFITHGLWFISRKMYLLGAVILAAMLGIYAFQAYHYDFLMGVYDLILEGNDAAAMTQLASRPVVSIAMFALSILRYAILIFSGLFGNHTYMKLSAKKIKKLEKKYPSREEYCTALESAGGVSIVVTLILGFLYLAAQYALSYLTL